MSDIGELGAIIHELHGAQATHVESVPVVEMFQGQVVWDGVVEVFDLRGHAKTDRAYAWSHDTDDPDTPKRHVTVLHLHPATSPVMAVRAAIMQELQSAKSQA